MEDAIKVVVRSRPLNKREAAGNFSSAVTVLEASNSIQIDSKPEAKQFTFDSVVGEQSTQESVFRNIGIPLTESCLQGFNGTIIAYGQTGSGKTHTLFGPSITSDGVSEHRGLVPRVFEYLWQKIGSVEKNSTKNAPSYSCKCSFYEVYNERVFDLLDNSGSQTGLNIREDQKKGVYVDGIIEEVVNSPVDAGKVLAMGYKNRHVSSTAMNRDSSRSHALFLLTVTVNQKNENGISMTNSATFSLVDLAGSERQKSTQTEGIRLKEASKINQSLSTLGSVIHGLSVSAGGGGNSKHIRYRDSALTFLLRDSLGGNSKTVLIANISPSSDAMGETLTTLKFAQRAKTVRNKVSANVFASGNADALQKELKLLRAQLAAAQQSSNANIGGIPSAEFEQETGISVSEALSIKKRCDELKVRAEAAEKKCSEVSIEALKAQQAATEAEDIATERKKSESSLRQQVGALEGSLSELRREMMASHSMTGNACESDTAMAEEMWAADARSREELANTMKMKEKIEAELEIFKKRASIAEKSVQEHQGIADNLKYDLEQAIVAKTSSLSELHGVKAELARASQEAMLFNSGEIQNSLENAQEALRALQGDKVQWVRDLDALEFEKDEALEREEILDVECQSLRVDNKEQADKVRSLEARLCSGEGSGTEELSSLRTALEKERVEREEAEEASKKAVEDAEMNKNIITDLQTRLREQKTEVHQQVLEFTENKAQLEERVAEAESASVAAQAEIEAMKAKTDIDSQKYSDVRAQLQEHAKDHTSDLSPGSLSTESGDIEEQVERKVADSTRQLRNELLVALQKIDESSLDRSNLMSCQSELQAVKLLYESSKTQASEAEERANAMVAQLLDAEGDISKSRNASSELSSLKERASKAERRLKKAVQERDASREVLQDIEGEVEDLRSKQREYEDILSEIRMENTALREKSARDKKRGAAVQGDSKESKALQSRLKDKENEVAELTQQRDSSRKVASKAIRELKEATKEASLKNIVARKRGLSQKEGNMLSNLPPPPAI